MDEVEPKSLADDLKQQSLETAKGLAPWRAGLPWWVVLVEGGVLGLVGILILIDPRKATLNVALFLAAALVVAGIIQIWSVLRGRAPEDIDSLIAAPGRHRHLRGQSGAVALLSPVSGRRGGADRIWTRQLDLWLVGAVGVHRFPRGAEYRR